MKLKPGRILLALLVLWLLGYGIQRFVIWRSPPRLEVQVDERVPAGTLFELLVNSNKQVEMTLQAGDAELGSSGSNWSVHLPAVPGPMPLVLGVVDGAGNKLEHEITVTGVAAPQVTFRVADQLVAGDPLALWLHLDPGDARIVDSTVSLDGVPVDSREIQAGQTVLVTVPPALDGSSLEVRAEVQDEFGRLITRERTVAVLPIERPVEVLQLPDDVLALQSDENQALQASLLAEAMADPLPGAQWDEPFLMPMTGFASSGYADPRRYFAAGDVSFHLGADLAAPTGTPVRATNDGVVVLARTLPVAGGAVVVDHGAGVSSRYYHLSVIDVQVGDRVQRGDVIAEVGSTGLSTGPHLHWEMRVDGEPSNPLAWAGRLLPGIDGPLLPDDADR